MKKRSCIYVIATAVVLGALCVSAAGCFGSGGQTNASTPSTMSPEAVAAAIASVGGATTTVTGATAETPDDQLSTFRSKDPFVPQAQPVDSSQTSETTVTGGGSSTIPGGGTLPTTGPVTTIFIPGPTTVTTIPSGGGGSGSSGGGGSSGGTGTTTPTIPTSTTSTTAPHVHTLRILAAAQVGGSPAVTFQVDGSVYKDRRVGDVVSTSWGQIKVVDINTGSRIVTLIQGSETLVLSVGQLIYQ